MSSEPDPTSPAGLFAQALADLRAGNLVAASAVCRALLARAPEDAATLQLAAAIALSSGDTDEALAAATASLRRRPGHGPALLIAGRAARANRDLPTAIAFFRQARDAAPTRAEAAFLLCAALLEDGAAEAQVVLTRLIEHFPDDAPGWSILADTLARLGRREAALVALQRAARAAPTVGLHLRRAALFRAAGNREASRAALDAASALNPVRAEAWFAIGLAAQDLADFPFAARAYRQALSIKADLAEAAANLGIVLQEMGDLLSAKQAYGQAIRSRPDTFSRIAQALAAAPHGELWLDLDGLRASLVG